jgi:hypothetical protein
MAIARAQIERSLIDRLVPARTCGGPSSTADKDFRKVPGIRVCLTFWRIEPVSTGLSNPAGVPARSICSRHGMPFFVMGGPSR